MKKLLYGLMLVLLVIPAQAQTPIKISSYPNTSTLSGTDLFLIAVPGVTNRNIRWNQLTPLMGPLLVNVPTTAIASNTPSANQVLTATSASSAAWADGLTLVNTNTPIVWHTNGTLVWASIDASVTNVFPPVLTNNTTGNAATATVASFVGGTLSNSITGNATTATTSTTANALATSATLTQAQVSNSIPAVITNAIVGWNTNASNVGTITLGQATYTNITGNITLGGLAGINASYWQNGVYVVTNGSGPSTPHSVTLPSTIMTATNSFVLGQVVWVTNKVNIAFSYGAYFGTNAAAVSF